jgi:hypothetical protein
MFDLMSTTSNKHHLNLWNRVMPTCFPEERKSLEWDEPAQRAPDRLTENGSFTLLPDHHGPEHQLPLRTRPDTLEKQ